MERLTPAASPAQEATPPRCTCDSNSIFTKEGRCIVCGGDPLDQYRAAPTPEASAPEPEHCQSCPAHPAYQHQCLCAAIRDHSTCIGHD